MIKIYNVPSTRYSAGSSNYSLTSRLVCVLAVVLSCSAFSWSADVKVKDIPIPEYPPLARMALLEGEVTVVIDIAGDGRVISAKGAGGDPILQRAAEKNAQLWTFESDERKDALPMKYVVVFNYRIVGGRVAHPGCPTVVLHLPDHIEISAQPPLVNPVQ